MEATNTTRRHVPANMVSTVRAVTQAAELLDAELPAEIMAHCENNRTGLEFSLQALGALLRWAAENPEHAQDIAETLLG